MPRVGARPRDDRRRQRLDRRDGGARARALPRGDGDRAGEPRHGRRQQHRHARRRRPLLAAAQLGRLGSRAAALDALVAFADAHPRAAVVGPRLSNPDGSLQRSVRGDPTLWRLATEYLFLRKLGPRTRPLQRVLRRRVRLRRCRARSSRCSARRCSCGARRPTRSGSSTRRSSCSARRPTGSTASGARAGRCWFTPAAEVVHLGGASHGGRLYVENLRGILRFLAKNRGPTRGRAGAEAPALVAAAAVAALPRRERGALPRGRALPRLRRRPLAALRDRRVPAARVRDRARAAARASSSRGRSGSAAPRRRSPGRSRRCSLAWAVVFVLHGTISLALVGAAVIGLVAAVVARRCGAAGGRPASELPPVRAAVGAARGVRRRRRARARCSGASRGRSPATRSSTRRASGSSSSSRTCTCARSTSSPAAGSIPATRSRSGTASSRSSRRSPGLDPSVVVHREASVLVPLACLVAWEAGVAVFRSAAGGIGVLAASLGALLLRRRPRRLVRLARAAGDLVAAAARAGRVRALLHLRCSSGRRADLAALAVGFGALALVHPTYALFALIPLGAYAVCGRRSGGARPPRSRRRSCPSALAVLWLRPLVDETLSRQPDRDDCRRRRSRTTAASSSSRRCTTSGSRPRCPGGPARSRSRRSRSCRSRCSPRGGRWGAFVLGGTVVDPRADARSRSSSSRFSNAVSLSQSRRAAGFVPFAFAFAGGLALLARSVWVLPFALAGRDRARAALAGRLRLRPPRTAGPAPSPGSRSSAARPRSCSGSSSRATGRRSATGSAALAAVLFVLPVAVHGFRHWTPLNPTDRRRRSRRRSCSRLRRCRRARS